MFSAVSVLAKTHLSPFTLYCEASRFFLTFIDILWVLYSPYIVKQAVFFLTFIDILGVLYHAVRSHSSSHSFVSVLCPCNLLPKIKFKR